MRPTIGFLLLLVWGCAAPNEEIQASNSMKPKNSTNGSNSLRDEEVPSPSKNSVRDKVQRAHFGNENWIDFTISQGLATIYGHSSEFKREAFVKISPDWGKNITSLKDLQEICSTKQYQTNEHLTGMEGQISYFANPLHWSIAQKIASKKLNELVIKVGNPFIISHQEITIDAEFLSAEDKKTLTESLFLHNLDNLDILRINLFNPLGGPGAALSSILARLFCGIAEGKASILYTFHNEHGESMRVRINGVSFEYLSY